MNLDLLNEWQQDAAAGPETAFPGRTGKGIERRQDEAEKRLIGRSWGSGNGTAE